MTTDIERLAEDIALFTDDVDTYTFMDAFDSIESATQANYYLLNEDPESILDYLREFDSLDDDHTETCNDLIRRIENMKENTK